MFEDFKKQVVEFEYDVHYKQMCECIVGILDENKYLKERKKYRKNIENLLNIDKSMIDIKKLKKEFSNILLNEYSSEILWMLNSIYIDEKCEKSYLDCVSDIFENSNLVVRRGINIYKSNGWMSHTLYVYQIANKNIAKNIIPNNFKTDKIEFLNKCFSELHNEYLKFDDTYKFIFKITTLIHDIGVVEMVREHGYHGQKFVEKVLKDIGITDEFLKENKLNITLKELCILEKAILKDHTIYTGVSSEFSDNVANKLYKEFLNQVNNTNLDKKKVNTILYMFTICDVIGVNECIFDEQKYTLLKEAKIFFDEIIDNKEHNRNEKQIAIKRICDFTGIYDENKIELNTEKALIKYNIDSVNFWKRLYNAGQFWFFLSIMKEIAVNFENIIRVLNCIFEVTVAKYGEDGIKLLSVTWFPNNHEKQAIENIENKTFFEAMDLLKNNDDNEIVFEKNRLAVFEKDNLINFEIEIL